MPPLSADSVPAAVGGHHAALPDDLVHGLVVVVIVVAGRSWQLVPGAVAGVIAPVVVVVVASVVLSRLGLVEQIRVQNRLVDAVC